LQICKLKIPIKKYTKDMYFKIIVSGP